MARTPPLLQRRVFCPKLDDQASQFDITPKKERVDTFSQSRHNSTSASVSNTCLSDHKWLNKDGAARMDASIGIVGGVPVTSEVLSSSLAQS